MPTNRTAQQAKTDSLINRIYDELSREFPELKVDPERRLPELRLVGKDHPYELYLATFEERDDQGDRRIMSLIWNQKEFSTYEYFNLGLREYTAILKERRRNATREFWTNPLTIGASIGILLVIVTACCLFFGTANSGVGKVPDQLWSILTAVIAFYFGRGSTGRTTRDEHLSRDDEL